MHNLQSMDQILLLDLILLWIYLLHDYIIQIRALYIIL